MQALSSTVAAHNDSSPGRDSYVVLHSIKQQNQPPPDTSIFAQLHRGLSPHRVCRPCTPPEMQIPEPKPAPTVRRTGSQADARSRQTSPGRSLKSFVIPSTITKLASNMSPGKRSDASGPSQSNTDSNKTLIGQLVDVLTNADSSSLASITVDELLKIQSILKNHGYCLRPGTSTPFTVLPLSAKGPLSPTRSVPASRSTLTSPTHSAKRTQSGVTHARKHFERQFSAPPTKQIDRLGSKPLRGYSPQRQRPPTASGVGLQHQPSYIRPTPVRPHSPSRLLSAASVASQLHRPTSPKPHSKTSAGASKRHTSAKPANVLVGGNPVAPGYQEGRARTPGTEDIIQAIDLPGLVANLSGFQNMGPEQMKIYIAGYTDARFQMAGISRANDSATELISATVMQLLDPSRPSSFTQPDQQPREIDVDGQTAQHKGSSKSGGLPVFDVQECCFSVSAYDTETESYLVPVVHTGIQTSDSETAPEFRARSKRSTQDAEVQCDFQATSTNIPQQSLLQKLAQVHEIAEMNLQKTRLLSSAALQSTPPTISSVPSHTTHNHPDPVPTYAMLHKPPAAEWYFETTDSFFEQDYRHSDAADKDHFEESSVQNPLWRNSRSEIPSTTLPATNFKPADESKPSTVRDPQVASAVSNAYGQLSFVNPMVTHNKLDSSLHILDSIQNTNIAPSIAETSAARPQDRASIQALLTPSGTDDSSVGNNIVQGINSTHSTAAATPAGITTNQALSASADLHKAHSSWSSSVPLSPPIQSAIIPRTSTFTVPRSRKSTRDSHDSSAFYTGAPTDPILDFDRATADAIIAQSSDVSLASQQATFDGSRSSSIAQSLPIPDPSMYDNIDNSLPGSNQYAAASYHTPSPDQSSIAQRGLRRSGTISQKEQPAVPDPQPNKEPAQPQSLGPSQLGTSSDQDPTHQVQTPSNTSVSLYGGSTREAQDLPPSVESMTNKLNPASSTATPSSDHKDLDKQSSRPRSSGKTKLKALEPLLVELRALKADLSATAKHDAAQLARLDELLGQLKGTLDGLIAKMGPAHPIVSQLAALQADFNKWRSTVVDDAQVLTSSAEGTASVNSSISIKSMPTQKPYSNNVLESPGSVAQPPVPRTPASDGPQTGIPDANVSSSFTFSMPMSQTTPIQERSNSLIPPELHAQYDAALLAADPQIRSPKSTRSRSILQTLPEEGSIARSSPPRSIPPSPPASDVIPAMQFYPQQSGSRAASLDPLANASAGFEQYQVNPQAGSMGSAERMSASQQLTAQVQPPSLTFDEAYQIAQAAQVVGYAPGSPAGYSAPDTPTKSQLLPEMSGQSTSSLQSQGSTTPGKDKRRKSSVWNKLTSGLRRKSSVAKLEK